MGGHDVYSMSKGAAELVTASSGAASSPPGALVGARGGGGERPRRQRDRRRRLGSRPDRPGHRPRARGGTAHSRSQPGGGPAVAARARAARRIPAARGAARRRRWHSPARFCEAWNFGPRVEDAHPVRTLVRRPSSSGDTGRWEDQSEPGAPHEAGLLRLSIEKASGRLGWTPRWTFRRALEKTLAWYRAHLDGLDQTPCRRSASSRSANTRRVNHDP